MRNSVVFTVITLVSLNAHAQFFTGNYLVQQMREWERASRRESGADYVMAARFSAFIAGIHDADNRLLICLPHGVPAGQANAVVAKYLNENPESWNEPAAMLVKVALAKAFPCR